MHMGSATEARVCEVDGERRSLLPIAENDTHEDVRGIALCATRALTPRPRLSGLAALIVLFGLGHQLLGFSFSNLVS
jgi:hypothetical protein